MTILSWLIDFDDDDEIVANLYYCKDYVAMLEFDAVDGADELNLLVVDCSRRNNKLYYKKLKILIIKDFFSS